MVSNASEDLPEPLRPVSTISCSRGISTSTFFRLFSLAPLMAMVSLISPLPYPYACTAHTDMNLRATLPPLQQCSRFAILIEQGHLPIVVVGRLVDRDLALMRQPERGRHLLDDPLVRQPLVHVGQRIALYLLLEVVVQFGSGAYPAFLAQILQYRPEQIVQLVVQIPVDEVQRLLNGGLVLPLLDQVDVHLLEELGVELEGV